MQTALPPPSLHPAAIAQPLTVDQASCWLQRLMRECVENVASLPTYTLHGATQRDALDRFELLSTHAGVLEQVLCRMCLFLPPDVVHTVVAIIAATHRQCTLLPDALDPAWSAPFILPPRTITVLTDFLAHVEARLHADARWVDSPEGRRLASAARALAQEVRVSRDAFAQGLCMVMATPELSVIPDLEAHALHGYADGLEDEDEWAPLREFLQVTTAFGAAVDQDAGLAEYDEAWFPSDGSQVFARAHSRSFDAARWEDGASLAGTLCADAAVHMSARQLEKSIALPEDVPASVMRAPRPLVCSTHFSRSSSSSSSWSSSSSLSSASTLHPPSTTASPAFVSATSSSSAPSTSSSSPSSSSHAPSPAVAPTSSRKRRRSTSTLHADADADTNTTPAVSHKRQRIHARFPYDPPTPSSSPAPRPDLETRTGAPEPQVKTRIPAQQQLPSPSPASYPHTPAPSPPRPQPASPPWATRPLSPGEMPMRARAPAMDTDANTDADTDTDTETDGASVVSAEDGYWQEWVVYDPAREPLGGGDGDGGGGVAGSEACAARAAQPSGLRKDARTRRCWDGVLRSMRGFFAIR
ncbi:hypothetical protein BC628DRAFT_1421049 [Trametes gibbosa]|nr:hypothetical protein BC628DRAFT_1421049 [Trametes gibbosa]